MAIQLPVRWLAAMALLGLVGGAAVGGRGPSAPQETNISENTSLSTDSNSALSDVSIFPDLFNLDDLWPQSIMDDIVDDLIGETFGLEDSSEASAEQNNSVPHADASQNEIDYSTSARTVEENTQEQNSGQLLEHIGSPVEHIRSPVEHTRVPLLSSASVDAAQHLANQTQGTSAHMPIRYEDPEHARNAGGIAVGHPGGECPPPVPSRPPGLCGLPPCSTHMECYPARMCCFNGCTYTCALPIPPAPVIDWSEDTDARMPLLDPANPALPLRFEAPPLSYGTGAGETVRLPGGCVLSGQEYDDLKAFMAAPSIQDCSCVDGEVACKVKALGRPKGGS